MGVRGWALRTWFSSRWGRMTGKWELSCQSTWRGQTVYRKALPRVSVWYAGYAIWITGCKIPSKETAWSQWCEAKLNQEEMSCWQSQYDQRNYFSIHGFGGGNIHLFSLFFLCKSEGGLSNLREALNATGRRCFWPALPCHTSNWEKRWCLQQQLCGCEPRIKCRVTARPGRA